MEKPLEVRSEVYAFTATADDDKPLKKMSKELGEKERIGVMSKFHRRGQKHDGFRLFGEDSCRH